MFSRGNSGENRNADSGTVSDEARIRRINYLVVLWEGAVFIFGSSFLSASVLSVFVSTFSGSMDLAALPASFATIFSSLGQLLISPYLPRIRRLDRFMHKIYLSRLVLFIVPILLFTHANPMLTIICFLAAYAVFNLFDGFALVPWTDIYARTIPQNQRGKLMGDRIILGGIASTIGGAIVKWLLDATPDDHTNYGFIFLIGCAVMVVTIIILRNIGDLQEIRESQNQAAPVGIRAAIQRMAVLLRENTEFRKITVSRVLITLSTMALPLTVLFGSNQMTLNGSQTSTLIYIQILGTVLGGFVWGKLSMRYDHKTVILTSFVLGMIIPAIAIILILFGSSFSQTLIFLMMILMTLMTGMNIQAMMVGAYNYQLETVSSADRAVSIMIVCILSLPLGLLASLAGVIAESFGFMPLMLLVLALSLLGFLHGKQLLHKEALLEYTRSLEEEKADEAPGTAKPFI